MAWTPIVGKQFRVPGELKKYINGLPKTIFASGMVVHNTAAPTLAQWTDQNEAQRIKNLERYFRDQRGWPSGPHAFVDDNGVWVFTPFDKKGTHSPSWNGTKLGIEMIGDFDRESVTEGRGLGVYKNTVALFAMLHEKYGWNPETIKFHKEDPRTTHDCPGKHMNKAKFISDVEEYMGHAGDLNEPPLKPVIEVPKPKVGVTITPNDTLNLREISSASSKVLSVLPNGSQVEVLGRAMNVETAWLRVKYKEKIGWVAARYVEERNVA